MRIHVFFANTFRQWRRKLFKKVGLFKLQNTFVWRRLHSYGVKVKTGGAPASLAFLFYHLRMSLGITKCKSFCPWYTVCVCEDINLPEAFPAVTVPVPSVTKAGRSFDRPSIVVPCLGNSSVSTVIVAVKETDHIILHIYI